MGIGLGKSSPTPELPAFTYQNMIKHITDSPIDNHYKIMQLLGQGSYAEVRKAKSKHSGLLRAVKIIDRKKHSKIEPLLMGQYDILKEMDHPNILKIFEIYEEHNYLYIVTELCFGRELFDILREQKYLKQAEVGQIFHQLVSAVKYLHSHGVMHRDLKPQNIMYDTQTTTLKLIDFGSALRLDTLQMRPRRRVGTSYYIAPQVIDRNYNHKCDIWSLGVVLFILLSGQPPFRGKQQQQVLANVRKADYNFKKPIWDQVSSQAKLLITQMMKTTVSQRPDINAISECQWVKKYANISRQQGKQNVHVQKILGNMNKFKQTKSNNIQGAMFVFIVNFLQKPEDQSELQQCFKELDLNGDGMLSLQEITEGIKKFLKTSQKQAEAMARSIFKRIDTNHSGFIDFTEFLVAANSIQIAASQQNLQLAFDYMDQDKNGWLTVQQIQARLGGNVPAESYQIMLKQFKKNSKGEINKQNFVKALGKAMKGKN